MGPYPEKSYFKQEMYIYCQSDVDILRKGCMKSRQLFLDIADIDPFQYITIANVCQAIYRSQFLPQNTIGIADEAQVDNVFCKVNKMARIYCTERKHSHQARL